MAMGLYSPALGADTIPNFISARTPQGLRRAMLRNNTRQKGYVKYHNIQFAQGRWYAWFDVRELDLEKVLEGSDGETT